MCYNGAMFWCSEVTGNPPKIPEDPLFFKKIVGVFFTTPRSFLHGGLISFGGATKLWAQVKAANPQIRHFRQCGRAKLAFLRAL